MGYEPSEARISEVLSSWPEACRYWHGVRRALRLAWLPSSSNKAHIFGRWDATNLPRWCL